MTKNVKIEVGNNANYEDIKRKVGVELFNIEKTEKLKDFKKIIIEIEVVQ